MRGRKPAPCFVAFAAPVVELGVVSDANHKVRKQRPGAPGSGCDMLKAFIAHALHV
jgi:hypothetical protein